MIFIRILAIPNRELQFMVMGHITSPAASLHPHLKWATVAIPPHLHINLDGFESRPFQAILQLHCPHEFTVSSMT